MVLLSCLQKNYGLIETNVQHEMKQMRNQLHEYTMIVNHRKVKVIEYIKIFQVISVHYECKPEKGKGYYKHFDRK